MGSFPRSVETSLHEGGRLLEPPVLQPSRLKDFRTAPSIMPAGIHLRSRLSSLGWAPTGIRAKRGALIARSTMAATVDASEALAI